MDACPPGKDLISIMIKTISVNDNYRWSSVKCLFQNLLSGANGMDALLHVTVEFETDTELVLLIAIM